MRVLSIILPVYNEQNYIYDVLKCIAELNIESGFSKQLLIVNDGSKDDSASEIERFLNDYTNLNTVYLTNPLNMGKGNAIRKALKEVIGEYVIIHDGDKEYNPSNWNLMIKKIVNTNSVLTIGNRFNGSKPILRNKYYYGNKFITYCFNLVSGTVLCDVESCSKLFVSTIIKDLDLKENRFGFEIEFMRKLVAKYPTRINEVNIEYDPRDRSQGKKINVLDGFRAIYCILKY